jgi:hypothetical protein
MSVIPGGQMIIVIVGLSITITIILWKELLNHQGVKSTDPQAHEVCLKYGCSDDENKSEDARKAPSSAKGRFAEGQCGCWPEKASPPRKKSHATERGWV